ncbi:MAG TPA: 30S ribosomal protein S6 [Candidatus Woesebacteria bacterium]|nr:30S ribosomal protein S6 [Candidatus Woesebacteria bacterium]
MKLTKEIIKKNYELTYLIPGDLLDADVSRLKKEIADLVAKNKGVVVKEDDWGRKHLAYNISQAGKVYEEAVYVHMIVNFPVLNVQKFEQSLTLHREILRHLLVIADELEESIKD